MEASSIGSSPRRSVYEEDEDGDMVRIRPEGIRGQWAWSDADVASLALEREHAQARRDLDLVQNEEVYQTIYEDVITPANILNGATATDQAAVGPAPMSLELPSVDPIETMARYDGTRDAGDDIDMSDQSATESVGWASHSSVDGPTDHERQENHFWNTDEHLNTMADAMMDTFLREAAHRGIDAAEVFERRIQRILRHYSDGDSRDWQTRLARRVQNRWFGVLDAREAQTEWFEAEYERQDRDYAEYVRIGEDLEKLLEEQRKKEDLIQNAFATLEKEDGILYDSHQDFKEMVWRVARSNGHRYTMLTWYPGLPRGFREVLEEVAEYWRAVEGTTMELERYRCLDAGVFYEEDLSIEEHWTRWAMEDDEAFGIEEGPSPYGFGDFQPPAENTTADEQAQTISDARSARS